jgi:dolichol-phosphate mannosyltransferase
MDATRQRSRSVPGSEHESVDFASALDYSVITATLNEAENILDLIQAITAHLAPTGKSFEIVVVDDNSSDGTAELVRHCSSQYSNVKLVSRPAPRGIGSAYLCGIQHSSGRVICTMDADFSHPPETLPPMLATADEGVLVLGSRFLRSGDFDTLWYRWLPTRLANLWHGVLLRSGVQDHTNGYLAMQRAALDGLLEEGCAQRVHPFDRILYGLALVALARRTQQPVVEQPATYLFRTRGETKIRFAKGVRLFFFELADSLRLSLLLSPSRGARRAKK